MARTSIQKMRKRQRELILVVAVAIAVMSCNNSANIALSFGMVLQTISRDVRRISNRVYRPPVQIPVVDLSLDIVDDNTCFRFTRFTKNQIHDMAKAFGFQRNMIFRNRIRCLREVALLYTLYRLGSYSTLAKDVQLFGRSESWLCTVFCGIVTTLYAKYKDFLLWDEERLTRMKLWDLANAMHSEGNPIGNVFGFVDGTMRHVCRPMEGANVPQEALYNGWKHNHFIKYQGITTPDGLIISIDGPHFGSTNDSLIWSGGVLRDKIHSLDPTMAVFGDKGYITGRSIMATYKAARNRPLTEVQKEFNAFMATKRISVENEFADIVKSFSFMANSRILRIGFCPVSAYFPVMSLFQNIRVCFNPNVSSAGANFPSIMPPSFSEYLHWDGQDRQDAVILGL